MATVTPRFGYIALRYTCRIPSRRKTLISPIASRIQSFHRSTILHNDDPEPSKPYVFDVSSLSPQDRDQYNTLSSEEKAEYEETNHYIHEHMTSPEVESELLEGVSEALQEEPGEEEEALSDFRFPKIKPGFFAAEEDDPQDVGEDEEFEGDDITSIGHAQLEQHREIRDYMRIAAWEMPMLSKLAKPFRHPPKDHPLRFRYTTYMGETHPAEKKIVLEFCTRDLPDLTEPQRIKLIKLVGPRYNPETDIVKMSCEMFETQAQNKRYLGDLVDTLMTEAQDGTDMFDDVPLDFRHHKYKPKLKFPKSWKLTEKRKKRLDINREKRLLAEREREEKGQISDGVQAIAAWLQSRAKFVEPVFMPIEERKQEGRGNQRRRPTPR